MDLNGGGCKGAQDMVSRLVAQAAACPNQKFALGGHSQGGAVVTAGLKNVPKSILPRIVAVTMFGSPPCSDVTAEVGGKCKSFCNKGDSVSTGCMTLGYPSLTDGRFAMLEVEDQE
jgi:alpha-beta hydrolase superfamily lysophospholipase